MAKHETAAKLAARKPGRPRTADPRAFAVTVKFTEGERAAVRRAARAARVTVAELIRSRTLA